MSIKTNVESIVTHDGKFHADEVVAVAMLWDLFPEAEIIRTRDTEVLNVANARETSICVDVGGGDFDHHHREFDIRRENGELYSSAGLVWKEYGTAFVNRMAVFEGIVTTAEQDAKIAQDIDNRFIRFVDRHDNGIFPNRAEVGDTSFSSVVSGFNPPWYEESKQEEAFHKAVNFAANILTNMVVSKLSEVLAEQAVLNAIKEQNDPLVLVLNKGMPWKPFVKSEHNAVFVVHPNGNAGYVSLAVEGSEVDSKTNRRLVKKSFPEEWRGLSDEVLSKVVGIEDMVFCHKGGFILVAKTLDSILKATTFCLKV